jgi:hypothetical protein
MLLQRLHAILEKKSDSFICVLAGCVGATSTELGGEDITGGRAAGEAEGDAAVRWSGEFNAVCVSTT